MAREENKDLRKRDQKKDKRKRRESISKKTKEQLNKKCDEFENSALWLHVVLENVFFCYYALLHTLITILIQLRYLQD